MFEKLSPWLHIWSILEDVPCTRKENVYSPVAEGASGCVCDVHLVYRVV